MTSPGETHTAYHANLSFLPRLLELDAELHGALVDDAIDLGLAAGSGAPVRRVLDVGAGTGTGTVALAGRFPGAEIVAVDIDEGMLGRVRARAQDLGLADRISTRCVDVGSGPLGVGSVDLAWSSAALHEVHDSGRALRHVFDVLHPGALLVVMEMDAPPLLLPASYESWEAGLRRAGNIGSPAHANWRPALEAIGFDSVSTAGITGDQVWPSDGPAGEYAALELRRIGHAVAAELPHADRVRLTTLAGDGPDGVRALGELWIRGTRTVWTARRPES